MGESSDTPLKLQFDRRVRLDFRGATITSDAGLLACRELDAALGLTETANDYIHENAPAAMCNTRCCPCSDNRCIAVSLVTRTPTTLNGLPKTRLCVSSSGGKVLISRQPAPTL